MSAARTGGTRRVSSAQSLFDEERTSENSPETGLLVTGRQRLGMHSIPIIDVIDSPGREREIERGRRDWERTAMGSPTDAVRLALETPVMVYCGFSEINVRMPLILKLGGLSVTQEGSVCLPM